MRVVVVGAGPMGASAARHLSREPGVEVTVIGPDAPADHHTHPGPHGAWHDEARLTRIVANDLVWSTLARESMARYPEIEAAGGMPFLRRTGVLYVHEQPSTFEPQWAVAQHHGVDCSVEGPEAYPYLRMPAGTKVIHERGDAGVVNPKTLVANQLAGAVANGATLVRDSVTGIEVGSSGVAVRLAGGGEVAADRVLVAAGAYLNTVLPEPLPVVATGITALFFEVDDADGLGDMPGMLWSVYEPGAPFIYTVPPTRYPDGKVWFKIGGYRESAPLHSAAEIDDWHRTDGGRLDAERLRAWVAEHVPVLAGRDRHAVGCVITDVASGVPLIANVVPERLYVASGCAGAAAKSCDEIGRLAAVLTACDEWDSPLDPAPFRAGVRQET
jgi:sarcosine oxidase